jgi:hypothetical protein
MTDLETRNGGDDVTFTKEKPKNKHKQERFWPSVGLCLAPTSAAMTATMREQEPIPVMPPSKLGEYTVVQEIAEGTFGKVKSMYLISYPIVLGL